MIHHIHFINQPIPNKDPFMVFSSTNLSIADLDLVFGVAGLVNISI